MVVVTAEGAVERMEEAGAANKVRRNWLAEEHEREFRIRNAYREESRKVSRLIARSAEEGK